MSLDITHTEKQKLFEAHNNFSECKDTPRSKDMKTAALLKGT